MRNPYTNRGMVRDPAMFFGRTKELTRIYALLGNIQSVSIVGDRRIGKSSLLYCLALPEVQTRIEGHDFSDYVFVHVDLQGSVHRSPGEFLRYLAEKLRAQARGRWRFKVSKKVNQGMFEEVVAQANEWGFKIVFLLDEFDWVTRNEHFDVAFFGFLRFMAINYDLALITASQGYLAEICNADIVNSPFFNIFGVVKLGALKRDEALELITVPSERAGCSLAEEAAWVVRLAGTQPLFVQIVCFYLFEAKARLREGEEIDYEAIRKLFYEEARGHFDYAFERVTDEDRYVLREEIWRDQGPYRHYLAASAEFRRFAREQSGWRESKVHLVTKERVEDVLEHLWDLAYLGQCPLAGLNIVRTRLAQNDLTPIGPDLGRALREVVIAAIECLRAEGEKGDKTDKRWRYWFILQRRYLEREHNKDIIAKLNVADRTFYRERREAIDAVVAVLQDMETHPDLG